MASFAATLAGFGGQGILFTGKVMAYSGVVEDKFVSWLPSYGPEMRGGTCNCHVNVSDAPIGSPIVTKPNSIIVMNRPSFEKFVPKLVPGGTVIYDSSLIDITSDRDDIKQFAIPATQMATDMGMPKLANMIMFGKYVKEVGFLSLDAVRRGLEKSVPPTKKDLLDSNWKAIETGYNY